MARTIQTLAILILMSETALAGPIVLDVYGKRDTQVFAKSVTKQGSPWGWVPELEVFVKVASSETDDVLVIQHYQNGKKWGPPQKCARGHYDEMDHVAEFSCKMGEDLASDKAGQFRAEIALKEVGANKTHDGIGSLAYSVQKYNCDNRHIKKRFAPSPCFVVNHDFRIGEAWLEETLPRGGYNHDEIDESAPSEAYLRMWIKIGATEPKLNLRCFYKDKVISKDGLNRGQSEIKYQEFPKANAPQQEVSWRKWWFALPDVAARPSKNGDNKRGFYLSENPGDYRCVATSDGDQVAELTFTVGTDGKVHHAPCLDESRRGAVNVSDRMHLIKVTHKKGFNLAYDANDYKTSPFYGKRWGKGCPP